MWQVKYIFLTIKRKIYDIISIMYQNLRSAIVIAVEKGRMRHEAGKDDKGYHWFLYSNSV